MAQRKIIWSRRAERKLFEILEFYTIRNKSTNYSRKLYNKFIKELKILKQKPHIGIMTDLEDVRGLIIEDFILFYEVSPEIITIHTVWDCRQNPESLNIK
jgi:plasmid stabilization system protein ParE